MPFLTDLDSRAAIKGSRDPLGLVPVWSRFGRQVVGNLTTVSNSVRGFTTLLLGYYFAQLVNEREGTERQDPLKHFLKFEQLAGYSRWQTFEDGDFRGRERVVERLGRSTKVTIGSDLSHQILSNQKIYGLWGLFSLPARTSGLLAPEERILTHEARAFVEAHYIKRLGASGFKGGKHVVDVLRRDHADVHVAGRDRALIEAIANILCAEISPAERAFYDRHLVNGGETEGTHGRQPLLADLLAELPAGCEFGVPELRATAKRAARVPDGGPLAEQLEDIDKMEALLAPMENAFLFLLTRDRQTIASVAADIRDTWGKSLKHVDPDAIQILRSRIADAFQKDGPVADRFALTAAAFREGDYEAALRLLLEHNAHVMNARNGSQPWVRVEKGKLDVRYRDEAGALIPKEELPLRWRNTYFINSLHTVVSKLRAA